MIRSTTDEMLAARFDPRPDFIPSRWVLRHYDGDKQPSSALFDLQEHPAWYDRENSMDRVFRPEPNPILVLARTYRGERLTMNNPKGWDHVLRTVEQYLLAFPECGTPQQIEDARKVLKRLAAL